MIVACRVQQTALPLVVTEERVYTHNMIETECLCTKVRRAALGVTAGYDQTLQRVGLKATQFSLLRTITRIESPTISTLAEATGHDRSTLGRNLRVLMKMGLVSLGPGEDERTRLVRLTADGRARIEAALPLWEEAQRAMEARLGRDRWETLQAILSDLNRESI